MQAAFDVAVDYVHIRKQFGKQVGTFQLMQGKDEPAISSRERTPDSWCEYDALTYCRQDRR